MQFRRAAAAVAGAGLLAASAVVGSPALAQIDDGTQFYVPKANEDSQGQFAELVSQGRKDEAVALRAMTQVPQAEWITSGSPAEAEKQVRQITRRATAQGTVPVLVAYNIPFRDCAQYSAGGATTVEEYEAWIDGIAAGIGDREAVVILEPDGLGIIPWYTNVDGNLEWCQPAEADAETAAAERFHMLNYAVDALQGDHIHVYLDATHPAWLNVGDITDRLLQAGVEDADGFFLNASNYQWTENAVQYGVWISKCIEMMQDGAAAGDCPNQYWNGGPDGTMIADLLGAWTGVALDPNGIWSDTATDPSLNTSGINARYAGVEGEKTFVIDTSRNGQGPWDAAAWEAETGIDLVDPQDWCNPPDRGLGIRPTTDTAHPLVDAYLWIKIPGESDGQCLRGDPETDPVRGYVNPAAGQWFGEQALELIEFAEPEFTATNPGRGKKR